MTVQCPQQTLSYLPIHFQRWCHTYILVLFHLSFGLDYITCRHLGLELARFMKYSSESMLWVNLLNEVRHWWDVVRIIHLIMHSEHRAPRSLKCNHIFLFPGKNSAFLFLIKVKANHLEAQVDRNTVPKRDFPKNEVAARTSKERTSFPPVNLQHPEVGWWCSQ